MPTDSWIAQDPHPGDFDPDLRTLDPRYIERRLGEPDVRLTIVGDDAEPDGRSSVIR